MRRRIFHRGLIAILGAFFCVACQPDDHSSVAQSFDQQVTAQDYYGRFRLTGQRSGQGMDIAVQLSHVDGKPQRLQVVILRTGAMQHVSRQHAAQLVDVGDDDQAYAYDAERIFSSDIELIDGSYYQANDLHDYSFNLLWNEALSDPLRHLAVTKHARNDNGNGNDATDQVYVFHAVLTAMGAKVDLSAAAVQERYFTAPVVDVVSRHYGQYRLRGRNGSTVTYNIAIELRNGVPQRLTFANAFVGTVSQVDLQSAADGTHRGEIYRHDYTVLWQNASLMLFSFVPQNDTNDGGYIFMRGDAGQQLAASAADVQAALGL